MAKSNYTHYLAITLDRIVVVNTADEAKKLTHKKDGGDIKGFDSHQEAMNAIPQYRAEIKRQMMKKKPKRNRYSNSSPKPKADLSYLLQYAEPEKPKNITLTCKLGTGGFGSTIKSLDCKPHIIKTSAGAKTALMNLELGYEALKLADNHIKQGADTVEIMGLDASVGKTLNNYAPNWKVNNWLNPKVQSPANLHVIQPMLELYEQIKSKVTLGAKQT